MNLGICYLGIILGMKPDKIELMPLGLTVSFRLKLDDYNKKILKSNLLELKKIIVAINGPAINFLIIVIIQLFNINFIKKDIVIYSNALIILFNLLPIYPLDGGRILQSILHIICGGKTAKKVSNALSNYLIAVLTIIASICTYYFKNIAFFLMVIVLWKMIINENKRYMLISNMYRMYEKEEKV